MYQKFKPGVEPNEGALGKLRDYNIDQASAAERTVILVAGRWCVRTGAQVHHGIGEPREGTPPHEH
jgi:hypothetical protein